MVGVRQRQQTIVAARERQARDGSLDAALLDLCQRSHVPHPVHTVQSSTRNHQHRQVALSHDARSFERDLRSLSSTETIVLPSGR